MFTGIVEYVGTVQEYTVLDNTESGGSGVSMVIENVGPILDDVHLGDSIAVNGVCLTVTEFTNSTFKVGIAPETLRRSTLGSLKVGSKVDLERAMSGHTRFGGHMVQGHVDTIGEIVERTDDGNALALTFKPRDQQILMYIVEKGFIALDGASLTVTKVTQSTFSVMLVAYTQEKIILSSKPIGEFVNIEADYTGKLIEKQVINMLTKEDNSILEPLVEKIIEKKYSKRQ